MLPAESSTRCRHLAEVFSHKPALVLLDDDGTIKHNGTLPGFLYRVAEEVRPEDACPHPRTTMGPGLEWLTARDLRLKLIGAVERVDQERLTEEDVADLRKKAGR